MALTAKLLIYVHVRYQLEAPHVENVHTYILQFDAQIGLRKRLIMKEDPFALVR